MRFYRRLFLASTFCVCSSLAPAQTAAPVAPPATLKDAFRGAFVIGAAINADQITGKDAVGDAIIVQQFNSISPENVLKWEIVHPQLGTYNFTMADKYVEFGLKNHMFIVGHNLCWHSQTPGWVFKDEKGDPITREALLQRLHDHIQTVVGRYKGKIASWGCGERSLE